MTTAPATARARFSIRRTYSASIEEAWALWIEQAVAILIVAVALELIVRSLLVAFVPFAPIEQRRTVADSSLAGFLRFSAPSFQALFHLGLSTAVIIDEKSAATEATQPVGTGPYKLSAWNKGSSATLDKWDGFRDPSSIKKNAKIGRNRRS